MDATATPPPNEQLSGDPMPPSPEELAALLSQSGPADAAAILAKHDDTLALDALQRLNPAVTGDIIPELPEDRRRRLLATGPQAVTRQWALNQGYAEDSVGRLMDPPTAVFRPHQTVGEVSRRVKDIVSKVFVTYCYVIDEGGRLVGVVTMRDLLVSDAEATMADVMLTDVFWLEASMPLMEAMREVVHKHFPVYPVCEDGHLIGLVRGHVMFEEQAFEISAQAGRMVGVDKQERLSTPWPKSLFFRHPWLQLNLLTAFVAAGVVGLFQNTLDQMVILAVFLPVLSGQSSNTGVQALAVTLRGLTLGEFKAGTGRVLVAKEALLGSVNGALVGVSAGIGMYIFATMQANPDALGLALVVTVAMLLSCVVSGICGALIPLSLQKVGADPATASSIFLTTGTDVVSMGLLLGLATFLLM